MLVGSDCLEKTLGRNLWENHGNHGFDGCGATNSWVIKVHRQMENQLFLWQV